MDVRTDHDAPDERSIEGATEPSEAGLSLAAAAPSSQQPTAVRREKPALQEASFLVIESGKIRFFVRPKVEVDVPRSMDDVQRFSFTLAPRTRGPVRRVTVGKKRLPDARAHERQWACVDRVGTAAHVVSDLGPRRYATKTRGMRSQGGLYEVASGTYAITAHRDHAHLMFELDPGDGATVQLLQQLGLGPRASYVAAVFNPESRWRVRVSDSASKPTDHDRRKLLPLDPVFLDHEGTELVLIGGDQSEAEDDGPLVRDARSS